MEEVGAGGEVGVCDAVGIGLGPLLFKAFEVVAVCDILGAEVAHGREGDAEDGLAVGEVELLEAWQRGWQEVGAYGHRTVEDLEVGEDDCWLDGVAAHLSWLEGDEAFGGAGIYAAFACAVDSIGHESDVGYVAAALVHFEDAVHAE